MKRNSGMIWEETGKNLFHKIFHPELTQNDYARNRRLERKYPPAKLVVFP